MIRRKSCGDESPSEPLVHEVYTKLSGCSVRHQWTIPAESLPLFRKLARAFETTIPGFLDAFTRKELPGQPKKLRIPKLHIDLTGGDVERVQSIARHFRQTVNAYIREAVKVTLLGDLTEIVWHPKTGKPLVSKINLEEFCRSQIR